MNLKNKDYYDLFSEMGNTIEEAIRNTDKSLNRFKTVNLPKQMEKLQQIESIGDEITHQIMKKLTKDFITPLERDDIINLAYYLDDIIDSIEEILQKIYMYNIKIITPQTHEFIELIAKCGKELNCLLKELPNFKKSKNIRNSIIEINSLEELADKLYLKSIHELYQKKDPVEIISWTYIYNSLEGICDLCEKAADFVDSVIMKNI